MSSHRLFSLSHFEWYRRQKASHTQSLAQCDHCTLRHGEVSALISFKMALLSYSRCTRRILNTVIVSTGWDLPSHFYATFASYSGCAPLKVAIHCTWLRSWTSAGCFFTCYSQPHQRALRFSNLPSLKEVIRSNMRDRNTVCSRCQPRDETNSLSVYSGKVIETWISQALRSTNWWLLFLQGFCLVPCRKIGAGFVVLLKGVLKFFIWHLKRERLLAHF